MTKWKVAAAVLALSVAFSGAFAQQKGGGKKDKGAAKAGNAANGKEILDRKSTRLNSSHIQKSRMPSSA